MVCIAEQQSMAVGTSFSAPQYVGDKDLSDLVLKSHIQSTLYLMVIWKSSVFYENHHDTIFKGSPGWIRVAIEVD